MTDKKEDAQAAEAETAEPVVEKKAHSTWKYTGEALGTVMPGGVPIATITEPGQTVEAADAEAATLLRSTGLFKYASGSRLPKESE